MFSNKKLFLIVMVLSILFLSTQVAFAQDIDNVTLGDNGDNHVLSNDNLYRMDVLLNINARDNHVLSNDNPKNKTVFIISDSLGTNILDSASGDFYNNDNLSGFDLVVRSGDQVNDMDEEELHSLFESSDAFIGEWISTDVDSVLTSLLTKYPEVSNKELFLILELPSGNLNSGSTSLNLVRNNTLNYNKIFSSCTDAELIEYFENTKRGSSYTDFSNYIEESSFNDVFNQLVLYKNLNDKDNLKDANGNAIANAKVTVTLNGAKKVLTTNDKGQVSHAISSTLAPKTYTAQISFDGDSNHIKSTAKTTVVVKKATPKMTAKSVTFKVKTKTKKYSITLKDNAGKVMKKVKVTIKVNGKTYSAVTDNYGKTTFKITKLTKKGKFTATIKYAGSKYFNALTKSVKITTK